VNSNGVKERSNHSRKPLRSDDSEISGYSEVTHDESLDESIASHSQDEKERGLQTDRQGLDGSKPSTNISSDSSSSASISTDSSSSVSISTDSSSNVSYVEESPAAPQKRHIPKSRQTDPMRIDFAGQIINSFSDETDNGKKASRKLRGARMASELRKEFEDSHRSGRSVLQREASLAEKSLSNSEQQDNLPTLTVLQREASVAEKSLSNSEQQDNLSSLLQTLETLEADLNEKQTVLELEKQSLESRVLEQVQRREELELKLQVLEKAYEKLKIQFPDPVDEIRSRREELQTENQVLKLRIKRQEDTLEKYQKPKLRNKHREIFRVSEVLTAPPAADSSLSQTASQVRFELIGLKDKIKERDETLEEQGVRRDELMAEIEKGKHEGEGGGEIIVMQARIAELEKEKAEFMKEMARLQKVGKELQEGKQEQNTMTRTLSQSEREMMADMEEMQSILEEGKKEEPTEKDTVEQNQDVGFIGWLFGAKS